MSLCPSFIYNGARILQELFPVTQVTKAFFSALFINKYMEENRQKRDYS